MAGALRRGGRTEAAAVRMRPVGGVDASGRVVLPVRVAGVARSAGGTRPGGSLTPGRQVARSPTRYLVGRLDGSLHPPGL